MSVVLGAVRGVLLAVGPMAMRARASARWSFFSIQKAA